MTYCLLTYFCYEIPCFRFQKLALKKADRQPFRRLICDKLGVIRGKQYIMFYTFVFVSVGIICLCCFYISSVTYIINTHICIICLVVFIIYLRYKNTINLVDKLVIVCLAIKSLIFYLLDSAPKDRTTRIVSQSILQLCLSLSLSLSRW